MMIMRGGVALSAVVFALSLQCSLAFCPSVSSALHRTPFPLAHHRSNGQRARCLGVVMSTEDSATSKLARRAVLLASMGLPTLILSPDIARAESLDDLQVAIKAARDALEPIAGYIQEEKWDKCRTTLNNPPLGFTGAGTVKDKMDQSAKLLPKGLQGAAKGIAQDLLTNIRLLDTFCYNNVFIDEGRQILGVKIDKKTPLSYLKSSKASFDEYLEMFP